MRQFEYFQKSKLAHTSIVSNPPKRLFPQERDWTCSIACIRSILSGITKDIPSENELIDKLQIKPGPLFSEDIKRLNLLKNYDSIYGADCTCSSFDDILSYMEKGYYVMLETMINFSHWLVVLGYYPSFDCDIENGKVLVYDPYYDKTRLLILDEFIQMWFDGNHNINSIKKDFIAIKAKCNQ